MRKQDHKLKYLDGDYLLKGEFGVLAGLRESSITNAERYAGWTIPTIFPDDPVNSDDEFQNDYQSVGAQAVNNLANKIMMALFQPSRPFFRLTLTPEQELEITENSGLNPAQIEEALAETERASMRELEKINARVVMTNCVQQLIVTGNTLLYIPPDNMMQSYTMRDYVVQRDLRGNMNKLIIKETKSLASLSDELAELVRDSGITEDDTEVSLYTGIVRIGKNRFVVWQELEDLCYCHERVGYYKEDDLPWIPLTWDLARNKDYGTGLVEMYGGDFHTLSTLAEAILDYTTIVTDVKILVDPTGMTNVRNINQASSGDYVHGREEDLYVHTANVHSGADFLTGQFDQVARRIGAAFLLNTAVTRDAERVTAEEIRMQAHELESSLGGVYSRLAVELQLPLSKRLLGKVDPVFKDIEPTIVTGLESLSRTSELDRTRAFFSDLIALSEVPEEVAVRIDYSKLISQLGAGHGIDYKDLLKDEKQVDADIKKRDAQAAQAAGMEAQAVQQQTG